MAKTLYQKVFDAHVVREVDGETPLIYKDGGRWYMVGAIHICPGCGGRVWALPDEEEAADMMARQKAT